ncbi:CU044_5270 family protein [Microtetraspora malaysiensis]|uniref:CU044_5270 family protein n=1 Tax=Microtetraspora malaysiensis TaxID=161358 RepID=UPI000834F994|nr:CU044_5270 family protein [Microtetraspora malaysiensis]
MNDLTEIKRLWEEVPPGSQEHLAGARTALLEAARTPAQGKPTVRVPRLRRYGLRIGIAGGLAAAMAAGVTVVQVGLGDSQGSDGIAGLLAAPPANAQQLLKVAAHAAAAEPDLRPGPGQYIHTETRVMNYWSFGSAGAHISRTEERWVPADGAKQWLTREQTTKAEPVPGVPMPSQRPIPGVTMETEDSLYESSCAAGSKDAITEAQMSDWPTDVAFLRKQVQAKAAKYTAVPEKLREWEAVGTLLRSTVFRPGLTAALYQITAEIPGITLVPDAVDAAGRRGIAVALENDGVRSELIFDKQTYHYLGEREVATKDKTTTVPAPPPISDKEFDDLKRQMVAKGTDPAEATKTLESLRKKKQPATIFKPRGAVIGSSAVVKVDLTDALPPLSTKVSRMKIPC